MKNILSLLILMFGFNKCNLSQVRHTISIEYNIADYMDKQKMKLGTFMDTPRPPSLTYEIALKKIGLKFSYKHISIAYVNRFSENIQNNTLLNRSTDLYGFGFFKTHTLFTSKFFSHYSLSSYVCRYIDFYHVGYRNPAGPLTEPVWDAKVSRGISFGANYKLVYQFHKKMNGFAGVNYLKKINSLVQRNILIAEIGIGYTF